MYVSEKSIAGLAHCSFIQFDDLWNHGVQIFRSDVLSPGPGWRHCQSPGYIQEQRSGQPITLQHPHKPLCEADNVLNIADPGGFSQTLPRMTCSSHMPGQQQLSLVVFMVSTVKHFLLLMTLHTYTLGATVQLWGWHPHSTLEQGPFPQESGFVVSK